MKDNQGDPVNDDFITKWISRINIFFWYVCVTISRCFVLLCSIKEVSLSIQLKVHYLFNQHKSLMNFYCTQTRCLKRH